MLLGIDGFDHYGTSTAAMLAGAWSSLSNTAPSTANPRNGTHALRLSSTNPQCRRAILQGVQSVIGLGAAFRTVSLPTSNPIMLTTWATGANAAMCSLCVSSTGALEIRQGVFNSTLLASSDPVFTANEYNHIEAKYTFAGASGAVEVKRNGVTVLDATNINIGAAATAAQFRIELPTGHGVTSLDVDDLYWWNDEGSFNNDFLGDRVVALLKPNQDTAESDWTRNAGSNDYEAIDDAAPDDDTTYVEATAPGDVSEYGLETLPSEVVTVTAVMTYAWAKKTDSGLGTIRTSLVSSDIGSPLAPAVAAGEDHAIGENYGYHLDIFETDPATGALWTPSALNAALARLSRIA